MTKRNNSPIASALRLLIPCLAGLLPSILFSPSMNYGQDMPILLQEVAGFEGVLTGDGKKVVEVYANGFQLLDLDTAIVEFHYFEEGRDLQGHAFCMSVDGAFLYVLYTSTFSGSYHTKIKKFDLRSGEVSVLLSLDPTPQAPIYSPLLTLSENEHYAAFTLQKPNVVEVFDLKAKLPIASISVEELPEYGPRFMFNKSSELLVISERSSIRGRLVQLDLKTLEVFKTERKEHFNHRWFIEQESSTLFIQSERELASLQTRQNLADKKQVVKYPTDQTYVCGVSLDGSQFGIEIRRNFHSFDLISFFDTSNTTQPFLTVDLAKVDEAWSFKRNGHRQIGIAGDKAIVSGESPSFASQGGKGIQLWSLRTAKIPSAKDEAMVIEKRLKHAQPVSNPYLQSRAKASFERWKKSSESGDLDAKFLTACCYMFGYHGIKSEAKAKQLLHQAADDGHNLSLIYLGTLSKPSPSESHSYFKKAMENGNLLAAEYLAALYREGIGVEKDLKRAFELSTYACSGKEKIPCALNSVGLSYLYGYGVKQDQRVAHEFFQKSAAEANGDAYYYLGSCFLEGLGVAADPEKAVSCFRQGAQLDSKMAEIGLAFCKAHGIGCERDIEGALGLYRMLQVYDFGNAEKMAEKLKELKIKADENESRLFYESLNRSFPSIAIGNDTSANMLYEARMSVYEAHRDWVASQGGNWGALGIVPVLVPGPPSR